MPSTRLPYRLGRALGPGGYAEAFEAESRSTPGVRVAFKRPRPGIQLADARLRREIEVQLGLDHPNVMPVLDFADDRSWYVMPLAAGSLRKLFEDGQLGPQASDVAGRGREAGRPGAGAFPWSRLPPS
jgi:serine/threonine protein kinase